MRPRPPEQVSPVDVVRLPQTDGERMLWLRSSGIGADALAAGEVAVILVAGGSGTALGFEGPKGTFPIGPVSSASLFQIHAEKIVALGKRFGRAIPLYVMTSPENHETTIAFFEQHDRFGLERLRFFTQGQMPAFDRTTGKILLAARDHIALAPDGHGGTITALAARPEGRQPSCIDEMRELGVKTLFYFQVDNPLVRVADPAFLGLHLEAGADISFKVVDASRRTRNWAPSFRSRAVRRSSSTPTSRSSWPAAACPRALSSSGPAASLFTFLTASLSSGSPPFTNFRFIAPSRKCRTWTRTARP